MDRLAGIQLFMRIVETGSFSRAAAELNLSQPTVTKQVAAIERRLNARLLNRNPRAISLTEIGVRYYEKCKEVVRTFEEAETIAGRGQTHVQGLLRVGTSLTFGRLILAPLLVEFMQQHPEVRVDVSHDDRYVDLIALGIDVAIRLGKLADSSLGGRYLAANPWIMVASPAYLAARGTPTAPADLARHECLVYTSVQDDDSWHLRTAAGERISTQVNGRLRSDNLGTLLTAALADMGIAVLPHYVAADAIAADQLRQIMTDHLLPDQEIHAIYPSPKLVPAKVTALIGFLERRFREDWWLRNAERVDCRIVPSQVRAGD